MTLIEPYRCWIYEYKIEVSTNITLMNNRKLQEIKYIVNEETSEDNCCRTRTISNARTVKIVLSCMDTQQI